MEDSRRVVGSEHLVGEKREVKRTGLMPADLRNVVLVAGGKIDIGGRQPVGPLRRDPTSWVTHPNHSMPRRAGSVSAFPLSADVCCPALHCWMTLRSHRDSVKYNSLLTPGLEFGLVLIDE